RRRRVRPLLVVDLRDGLRVQIHHRCLGRACALVVDHLQAVRLQEEPLGASIHSATLDDLIDDPARLNRHRRRHHHQGCGGRRRETSHPPSYQRCGCWCRGGRSFRGRCGGGGCCCCGWCGGGSGFACTR